MAGLPDRFDVVRELGRGGMGVVWLATDKGQGRTVAVKQLNEAAAQDARTIKRFRREAQMLARLEHPNVVKLLAFEERPEPGRLRLPGGREWPGGPFRKVSFWHAYLTFPR